jgi:hypothetical protein
MDPHLKAALEAPTLKLHLALALEFAELEIRKYIWRGQRSRVSSDTKAVIANSRTADDFVAIALERLVQGQRKYQQQVDLFLNLKSIIRSLVNSHKKSSDRTPLVDIDAPSGEAEGFDPTLLIGDLGMLPPNELLDGKERHTAAKSWRAELRSSLQNKPELLAVADAIFEEITDCSEIAVLCDCSVERVYELKRALKKHTIQLFGVRTTAELERKTMGT